MVSKNDKGDICEIYNQDKMLSDVLKAINPELERKLNIIKRKYGCFSLSYALHVILSYHARYNYEAMTEEIKEMFSDIRVSGAPQINEDVFYKRKHNKWDEHTTTYKKKIYRTDI